MKIAKQTPKNASWNKIRLAFFAYTPITDKIHCPWNSTLDRIKHHLYVCPMDSKALERHLLSRNHLRKNEEARIKYQQMKYELAEQSNQDRKKYQELKELQVNDFIDSIIEMEKNEGAI